MNRLAKAAAILGATVIFPSMALADNANSTRLLKSWLRSADPVAPIVVTGGSSVDILSPAVSVTCPAGLKCAVEVEADFSFEQAGSGIQALVKTAVGTKERFGGPVSLPSPADRVPYHWTYVTNVNPGTYPVQVTVVADANMTVDLYTVSIRLHKRP